MNEKLTIDDIAAALGVSKTTVSRAISGKGRLSPETIRRVQQYIDEHGYTPNHQARGLAKSRTFNIGVVCPVDYELFDLQYFHRCLQGISQVTGEAGYDILISMVAGTDVAPLRRLVENHKADGVILTRTMFDDPVADYLKKSGLPFLVIGTSPDPDLVQVDNDHLAGCCELTQVLLGKGFRRLALLGGDGTHTITATRRRGFELAYERLGLRPDPSLIYMDVSGVEQTETVVKDVIAKKADCLVCMDEKLTGLAQTACRQLGVVIPRDLRLASFYNSSFLQHSVPAVTALDIDDKNLGSVAARELLSMIDGNEPQNQLVRRYQVILRESTAVS